MSIIYTRIIFYVSLFFAKLQVLKFKDRAHCFSMQVVMKCFLLNPEKKIWR